MYCNNIANILTIYAISTILVIFIGCIDLARSQDDMPASIQANESSWGYSWIFAGALLAFAYVKRNELLSIWNAREENAKLTNENKELKLLLQNYNQDERKFNSLREENQSLREFLTKVQQQQESLLQQNESMHIISSEEAKLKKEIDSLRNENANLLIELKNLNNRSRIQENNSINNDKVERPSMNAASTQSELNDEHIDYKEMAKKNMERAEALQKELEQLKKDWKEKERRLEIEWAKPTLEAQSVINKLKEELHRTQQQLKESKEKEHTLSSKYDEL
jgi:chromosome segregation ATPase